MTLVFGHHFRSWSQMRSSERKKKRIFVNREFDVIKKKKKKLDCVFWSVSVLASSQQPTIIMKTPCHVQRRWQLGGCYENNFFFVLKRICRGQKNRWQKISGMQWKAKSLVSLWSLNCFSVCPQLLPFHILVNWIEIRPGCSQSSKTKYWQKKTNKKIKNF